MSASASWACHEYTSDQVPSPVSRTQPFRHVSQNGHFISLLPRAHCTLHKKPENKRGGNTVSVPNHPSPRYQRAVSYLVLRLGSMATAIVRCRYRSSQLAAPHHHGVVTVFSSLAQRNCGVPSFGRPREHLNDEPSCLLQPHLPISRKTSLKPAYPLAHQLIPLFPLHNRLFSTPYSCSSSRSLVVLPPIHTIHLLLIVLHIAENKSPRHFETYQSQLFLTELQTPFSNFPSFKCAPRPPLNFRMT
ncbi:hypothetical protein EDB80DRAFT_109162 [Ilyonectria destructans]|nr:hypothetical protein EDB80DRAFT_109162 [Ilyonectria destructans]